MHQHALFYQVLPHQVRSAQHVSQRQSISAALQVLSLITGICKEVPFIVSPAVATLSEAAIHNRNSNTASSCHQKGIKNANQCQQISISFAQHDQAGNAAALQVINSPIKQWQSKQLCASLQAGNAYTSSNAESSCR